MSSSLSILVYPNITYARDLEKDSYVIVLHNIIKGLSAIRDDLEWTILSPKLIQSLVFDNTRQIPLALPTYPNQMRLHFDSSKILSIIDWKARDYDIVYSHLPEHTLQLKNLFFNLTNIRPVFIGYSHWTEFPEITNYSETVMAYNFLGLASMSQCGINTEAQKQMVLKHARGILSSEMVQKIDETVTPQYLGWEVPQYDAMTVRPVIVFNHRAHPYKKYDWFLQQMDILWAQRQDFSVWVPLADSKDREYVSNHKYDRYGYLSELSGCCFGVCGEQKYAGWSVSATDGLSVGVPFLFYDAAYYHELAGDAGLYFTDNFNELANQLLDNRELRDQWGERAKVRFENNTWGSAIVPFHEMLNKAASLLPVLKNHTAPYEKILAFVREYGTVTKKDILKYMGWGVMPSWWLYRNRLRQDGVSVGSKYYVAS